LLQIHWPDRYVPIFGASYYNYTLEREATSFEEQLLTLDKLVKAGKIRYIGVSNETPYGIMRFSQVAKELGLSSVVSVQNSYSLINRLDYEIGLAETCSPRNENIGLLAYSPLAGGILTGKYANADDAATKNSRLNLFQGYMGRYKQSLAVNVVAKYCQLAKKYDMTPTQLALGWCYKNPYVASTIIGATSIPQLVENLESYDEKIFSRIRDEDIDEIHKACKDPSKI